MRRVMSHLIVLSLATVAVLVVFPIGASGATSDTRGDTQSFLKEAAEEQLLELSLGQLATERAVNIRVKEFAAEIVEDHKKANQELARLALKEGVLLSPALSQKDKSMVEQLSRLSGYDFDRQYMNYLIRDHEKAVEILDRWMKTMHDPDIGHWVNSIMPLFEFHRIRARLVMYELGENS